jgi:hypothetical protein
MMGRASYPKARQLLITAYSGGSNGARVRLWKWEIQKLAMKPDWRSRSVTSPWNQQME